MSLPSMATQDQWNSMNAHTRIPNDKYTCRVDSKRHHLQLVVDQLERHNEIKCSNWDATVTWKSLEHSMYESKEPVVPLNRPSMVWSTTGTTMYPRCRTRRRKNKNQA